MKSKSFLAAGLVGLLAVFLCGCKASSSTEEPISLISESGTIQVEKIKKDLPEVKRIVTSNIPFKEEKETF